MSSFAEIGWVVLENKILNVTNKFSIFHYPGITLIRKRHGYSDSLHLRMLFAILVVEKTPLLLGISKIWNILQRYRQTPDHRRSKSPLWLGWPDRYFLYYYTFIDRGWGQHVLCWTQGLKCFLRPQASGNILVRGSNRTMLSDTQVNTCFVIPQQYISLHKCQIHKQQEFQINIKLKFKVLWNHDVNIEFLMDRQSDIRIVGLFIEYNNIENNK